MSATQSLAPHADAPAPVNPGRIMELGLAFWGSKTLLSAVELGVFTELAAGPRHGDELAARLGLHPRSASDFLDALVALGMLARRDGAYANTAETDLFLDRGKPSYIGGMLEMANTRLHPFWGWLTDALQTGEAQNEARTGGDFFASLYADPQRSHQFLHAMTGLSAGASIAIAERFPFDRYRSVLDLGCAEGGLLVQLARTHPHLRAIGLDLPAVRDTFERYVRSFELQERIAFVAGDFFNDRLPEADVITLGHVLHDWNLEQKKQLLRRCLRGAPVRRRGDRVRGDRRRRSTRECVRTADEPEHADRDARRFRLHRRRLPALDARDWLCRHVRRAPGGSRFDGRRDQVANWRIVFKPERKDPLMAYLLTHFWPAGTLEQYRTTLTAVHPADGLPAGQVYHAAGETQGGVLIAAVWNSKEDADRFVSETLLARLPIEGGLVGPPEERAAEIANLETA